MWYGIYNKNCVQLRKYILVNGKAFMARVHTLLICLSRTPSHSMENATSTLQIFFVSFLSVD